ncbi:MAG: Bax inhibitor-1/YccA family protein [Deltaproteobacteria bacterium]|nr:Bax inhibitor-1/YccA family protein [Deltaproteobacteria bacterium]
MRTSNPALSSKTFGGFVGSRPSGATMTISGATNKTGVLLALAIITAVIPWRIFFKTENPALLMPYLIGGGVGGFVMALVTIFKKEWSPVTAPAYALAEGLLLGAVSALFELRYPGLVLQAVGLTFGTLGALLVAYKTGVIKATENFKLGVVAATGAIGLFYLVGFVLRFFGINMPLIHSSGTFGILFSLGVVVVAALNLVLDFDFIEEGAQRGAPKYMEWYAAFGLMVTLVWLYLEVLRLLSKLQDRRR